MNSEAEFERGRPASRELANVHFGFEFSRREAEKSDDAFTGAEQLIEQAVGEEGLQRDESLGQAAMIFANAGDYSRVVVVYEQIDHPIVKMRVCEEAIQLTTDQRDFFIREAVELSRHTKEYVDLVDWSQWDLGDGTGLSVIEHDRVARLALEAASVGRFAEGRQIAANLHEPSARHIAYRWLLDRGDHESIELAWEETTRKRYVSNSDGFYSAEWFRGKDQALLVNRALKAGRKDLAQEILEKSPDISLGGLTSFAAVGHEIELGEEGIRLYVERSEQRRQRAQQVRRERSPIRKFAKAVERTVRRNRF